MFETDATMNAMEDSDLQAGDEVDLARDLKRAEALEKIRQLARPFPVDYEFDRDDANA